MCERYESYISDVSAKREVHISCVPVTSTNHSLHGNFLNKNEESAIVPAKFIDGMLCML